MKEKPLPEALDRLFEPFTEPNNLFTALVSALGAVLPCDRCFLYLREPTQKRGIITHCWSCDGHDAETWLGADWLEDPSAPEDPLMTIALRTPVAVFVDDVETTSHEVVDRAYEREKFRHRALVHAPIYDDHLLIGILECSIFAEPRVWTEGDRQLIACLQAKLTEPANTYIEQYQPFKYLWEGRSNG
ncbi:MAG: GAF domain-containing protein [Lyngbya sp. HA4199-MV5]|jgi:GAF domain-containing protein|nr:GAF domain-containing protein [Lyngbya sp. HA4199-MV5]